MVSLALVALIAVGIAPAGGLYGHDEGHATPGRLPPIGPHGGAYARLQKHFAEVVIRPGAVTLYILEPDVKYVAEDASSVTLAYEIPGLVARRNLSIAREGAGYSATLQIPATARRVIFYAGCVLDGNAENGQIVYEPRR